MHSCTFGDPRRVVGTALTKNGQRDVDEQIDAAATLEEDSKRGEDDGKDDLANVSVNNVSISV